MGKISRVELARAAGGQVVDATAVDAPLVLDSIELLREVKNHFVRVTSGDLAGFAIAKPQICNAYTFFEWAAEFFVGKDARQIDALADGAGAHGRNYKYASLAFWMAVAVVEVAALDLLGKAAGRPVSALLGGARRTRRASVPVYLSSMARHTTAEEEVDKLAERLAATGARAVKFKIGGRMSGNADASPGRTEKLVALARGRLGDDITIYADANGSYDAKHAARVGRILEAHNVGFFEEPCPWEELEQTREVNQALSLPVAGGEQDASLPRFNWMLRNGVVSVLQPDLYYVGGVVRLARVARMAAAVGMPLTQHSSCSGAVAAPMTHFAAAFEGLGPFQEYRVDEEEQPWCSPTIRVVDGAVETPDAPGLGLEYDPAFVASMESVFRAEM